MRKVEQNKEKKRQAIQKAAQDIFLSEGYVLASMDRIAAQAQVTKQTIYRYSVPFVNVLRRLSLRPLGKALPQSQEIYAPEVFRA